MATRFWQCVGLSFPIVISSLASEPLGQAQEPFFAKNGIGTVHPLQEKAWHNVDASAERNGATSRLNQAEHLYVFCVNGGDPLCFGNFNGLTQLVKSQGCPNTYFGQLWHASGFYSQIREIRASDAQARFVLIGFSAGANRVRAIANDLNNDRIPVALMVYIAGDAINNSDYSRPTNVARILNIRAHGFALYGGNLIFKGEEIDGARNIFVNVRHMLLPSRSETIEPLLQELRDVALKSN